MADRYWVGGNGTWNGTNTTNWSTTSGGSGGASVPTALDTVYFNNSSGTSSNTVTVGSGYSPVCLSLYQTSAAPKINGNGSVLSVGNTSGGSTDSGNISSQSIDFSGFIEIYLYGTTTGGSSTISIFSGTPCLFLRIEQGVFTLTTTLSAVNLRLYVVAGSLNASSQVITTYQVWAFSGASMTLTNAQIQTSGWIISSGASANTSAMTSLRVPYFFDSSGSFSDSRAGSQTYSAVTLGAANGSAGGTTVNIAGGASFTSLTISERGVTFTGGQTLSSPSLTFSSLSTNPVAVLTATGGQVTLSSSAALVTMNGLVISNCNATGGATFTADATSVDAGNNTGIQFANSRGLLAFFT